MSNCECFGIWIPATVAERRKGGLVYSLSDRGSDEDRKDWQSGFDAGRAGKPFVYPADVKDLFAWTSGYIEGRRSTLNQIAEDRK